MLWFKDFSHPTYAIIAKHSSLASISSKVIRIESYTYKQDITLDIDIYLLFIYFLETKIAIFTKNKSLTGFWPRWISLNCLPITEMFRHNNLRQKCLPKPLNINSWTYSTLEVIQHPLLWKYFIYIKEALKGIARHSQYKQVSNELFFISHHLNEIDLLCYSFSK